MSTEINVFKKEAEKQRRIIIELERERERLFNDNSDLSARVLKVSNLLHRKLLKLFYF